MLKEGLCGAVAPNSLLGGTGSPPQVVVGAQEGPAGGSGCQRPGHTCPGRQGDLPGPWSVLKDGLGGVAVSNCLGTPASGDGESCPNDGRCSRRARGGQ